ncbi:MAG TPA: YHYH protein [Chryseosolibacter sp.]|nr:YHYH protein [Chryseosolibacter sp.]
MTRIFLYAIPLLIFVSVSCDDNDETGEDDEVPAVFAKFYGATDVYAEGDYIVIKSTAVPDHKSPYFEDTQWESTMYVADTRPGFSKAPNKIASFNYTFKIPRNPKGATNHQALGTATIGVAVNGIPLFNQYAAQNTPIVVGQGEYTSFDLYGGHPAPTSDYHYHIEPKYITAQQGSSALIGFLLDGFPVYGPLENGQTITNDDLDEYHGHTSATADYPDGIYHYHTTSAAPFINGNGYYGTPGTWTK